jgi:hypothetical protein
MNSPANGSTDISPTTNIVLSVADSVGTIGLASLAFIVDGTLHQINSPNISYTGSSNNYTITITPSSAYQYGKEIFVIATASDGSGNTTTATFSFTTSGDPILTSDTSSPVIDISSPKNGDTDIKEDSKIEFSIDEPLETLDLANSYIYLNGVQIFLSDGSQINYTQVNDVIEFEVTPISKINEDATNSLIIYAVDLSGNSSVQSLIFNEPVPGVESSGGQIQPTIQQITQVLIGTNSEKLLDDTILKDTIVDQVVSTIGVTGTGAAASMFLLTLNLIPLLSLVNAPTLLLNLAGIYLGLSKRKPWGLILDKITNKPIEFAVCRLYVADSKSMIEQSVSDQEGRYGFAVKDGSYRLEITKDEYLKYSVTLNISPEQITTFPDIYLISSTLSPKTSNKEKGSLLSILKKIMRKVTPIIFVLGLILSVISVISLPTILNIVIGAIYLIVVMIYARVKSINKDKYASVVDTESGLKLPNAIVKVFSIDKKELVDTILTNNYGQFVYWGEPGRYAISVQVNGYSFPSSKYQTSEIISLNTQKLLIVELEKGRNKIQLMVDPEGSIIHQNMGTVGAANPYGYISVT